MSSSARPQSAIAIADRVHIDGDESVVAVVTALLFRTDRCEVEISWMNQGVMQVCWVPSWRVKRVEEDELPF